MRSLILTSNRLALSTGYPGTAIRFGGNQSRMVVDQEHFLWAFYRLTNSIKGHYTLRGNEREPPTLRHALVGDIALLDIAARHGQRAPLAGLLQAVYQAQ